jgi:hypothetical protein
MADLIRAEWLKVWNGRLWWVLSAFTLLMCAMAGAGFVSQATHQPPAGPNAAETLTQTLVNSWFMAELAAALITMICVTREFGNGAINRSVLLSGGRSRLMAAKLIVAGAVGVLFAVVTGVLAAVSPWVLLLRSPYHPVWTGRTTATVLGVMAVVVAGALWGSTLGVLIRNQVLAIVVMLLNTWLVSEALFRLVPAVGRFTIDEAMASIYQDDKPNLLSLPAALAVLAGWLVLAAVAGRARLLRRDLP